MTTPEERRARRAAEKRAAVIMLRGAIRRNRLMTRTAAGGHDPLRLALLLADLFGRFLVLTAKREGSDPESYITTMLEALDASEASG